MAEAQAVPVPVPVPVPEENKKEKPSPIQMAATVVTAMGAENAAAVYKHLTDEDIEKLT